MSFRRPDERLELLIGQLNAIKSVVEITHARAQILLVDSWVTNRRQPRQPDDPIRSGRVVDPAERIGGGEVHALVGDRSQAAPGPIALQRVIEAALLRD